MPVHGRFLRISFLSYVTERSRALPLGSTHGQGCLKLSAEGADSSVSAKLIILYGTGGAQLRAAVGAAPLHQVGSRLRNL